MGLENSKSDQEDFKIESISRPAPADGAEDLEATQEQEDFKVESRLEAASVDDGKGAEATQEQAVTQSNTKKSKIECDDVHRKIFNEAERGNINKVHALHRELFKSGAADEMPLGVYVDEPSLGAVPPLVVLLITLCGQIDALYAHLMQIQQRSGQKDDKPFRMDPQMVELLEKKLKPLEELFIFYEIQKPDKDGIHPLHRGKEKSAPECFKKLFRPLTKEHDCFLLIKEYVELVCARVAEKAAKAAKKEVLENPPSKWWDCIFAFWKQKKATNSLRKVESVTLVVDADSYSSNSSNSCASGGVPSPSSSAKTSPK